MAQGSERKRNSRVYLREEWGKVNERRIVKYRRGSKREVVLWR